ncbi:hypothetical protein Hanom_Chr02g00171721 [Helianthus anomalus]
MGKAYLCRPVKRNQVPPMVIGLKSKRENGTSYYTSSSAPAYGAASTNTNRIASTLRYQNKEEWMLWTIRSKSRTIRLFKRPLGLI